MKKSMGIKVGKEWFSVIKIFFFFGFIGKGVIKW